jgi:argininosuccinate lyase
MTEELKMHLEDERISEPDIVNLIITYMKLVKLEVLTQEDFTNILGKLGIEKKENNVFVFDEDNEYEFN